MTPREKRRQKWAEERSDKMATMAAVKVVGLAPIFLYALYEFVTNFQRIVQEHWPILILGCFSFS